MHGIKPCIADIKDPVFITVFAVIGGEEKIDPDIRNKPAPAFKRPFGQFTDPGETVAHPVVNRKIDDRKCQKYQVQNMVVSQKYQVILQIIQKSISVLYIKIVTGLVFNILNLNQ